MYNIIIMYNNYYVDRINRERLESWSESFHELLTDRGMIIVSTINVYI